MRWLSLLVVLGAQDDALKSYPFKILFETRRDGNWEIYRVNADGSNPVNLTKTEDIDELYPKASPDGRHIAFMADERIDGKKVRNLYYMKADGTGRTKIADGARDPCWSPDGKEIAFLPSEYARYTVETWATKGLRLFTLDTGRTRDHPNDELEHLYTLAWSPDGKWFFATVHGGLGYGHAILAIEAGGRRVHNLGLEGCRPDVAADGGKIVWGHGDYALGVGRLDFPGDRPKVLDRRDVVRNRDGMQTYHADWSPDGKYIVYSSGPTDRRRGFWSMPQNPGVKAEGWDLFVADASGKNQVVRITSDGSSNKEPDWVPSP
ncbi:MAG: PD40 domain-containing protein [Planctomycetes bacterium]|nr:PD40 domain-containing protein [Planctomycetota bacterium]